MKSDDANVMEDTVTIQSASMPNKHIHQLFSVFALQMRLYSKSVSTYILIALALMIPVLVYSGFINKLSGMFELNSAYVLLLMPLMIVAIPARFSGNILSSEFKNRTAFINFPLPMSRTVFYLGKFLAALLMSLSVMLLAIGGAILSSNQVFGFAYPNDIASMLIVCITGMVALLAMTYFFGTFLRRGAGIISIILTLAIPYVLLLIVENGSGIWDAATITPFFSSYHSLWLIDNGILGNVIDDFIMGPYSAYQIAAVSIIWGTIFLVLGALVTNNREV